MSSDPHCSDVCSSCVALYRSTQSSQQPVLEQGLQLRIQVPFHVITAFHLPQILTCKVLSRWPQLCPTGMLK